MERQIAPILRYVLMIRNAALPIEDFLLQFPAKGMSKVEKDLNKLYRAGNCVLADLRELKMV